MDLWADLASAAAAMGVQARPTFARGKLVSRAPVLGGADGQAIEWKLLTSAMTVAAFEDAELLAGWFPRVGGRIIAAGMHNDAHAKEAWLAGLRPRPGPRVEGTAFLMGGHADNLWHFLYNAALRLAALEDNADDDVRIVVPEDLKASFLPLLEALGFPRERFVAAPTGAAVRFERLIVSELPFYRPPGRPVVSPQAVAWLRGRLGAASGPDRRIYLSRADARWRRVLNEAEVVEALAAEGFEAIRLSSITPSELIDRMRTAGVVVGPSGANLAATLFCPAGARVVELTPEPHLNNYYFQTASAAGGLSHLKLAARAGPGPEPEHRWDFTVDPALALEGVRRALAG